MKKTVWKYLFVASAIGMVFGGVLKEVGTDSTLVNDSIPPTVLCCTIEQILSNNRFSGTVSLVSENQTAKITFGDLSVGDTVIVEAEHFRIGTITDVQGNQVPYVRDQLKSSYIGYTVQIDYLEVVQCCDREINASTVLLRGALE